MVCGEEELTSNVERRAASPLSTVLFPFFFVLSLCGVSVTVKVQYIDQQLRICVLATGGRGAALVVNAFLSSPELSPFYAFLVASPFLSSTANPHRLPLSFSYYLALYRHVLLFPLHSLGAQGSFFFDRSSTSRSTSPSPPFLLLLPLPRSSFHLLRSSPLVRPQR